MQLIIGLGNYGQKYENTRHNFGFIAIDHLAKQHGFSDWKEESKFFGWIARGEFQGEKTILCKPKTYMNLSGKSIQGLSHFYRIPVDKITILSDDLDQDFGKTKYKTKGSAGGQKGLADIIRVLGSSEFARLKFGISSEKRKVIPTAKFVLSKFTKEEKEQMPEIIEEGLAKL